MAKEESSKYCFKNNKLLYFLIMKVFFCAYGPNTLVLSQITKYYGAPRPA